ncbi:MAG TPA: hypothetical protein DCY13_17545 [Verrucomicrobiales bacterium]|nr:hypothetical protein [Verrucomicrobiales bacterium]
MRLGFLHRTTFVAAFCLGVAFSTNSAFAGDDKKLEVLLIWGTNQEKSSDPAHKKVDSATSRDFKKVYKWENYFVINRKNAGVEARKKTEFKMSDQCRLEVKHLGDDRFEVWLWGKDAEAVKEEAVCKGKQSLPKGERLILMGLNENESGWFVLIRHKE